MANCADPVQTALSEPADLELYLLVMPFCTHIYIFYGNPNSMQNPDQGRLSQNKCQFPTERPSFLVASASVWGIGV